MLTADELVKRIAQAASGTFTTPDLLEGWEDPLQRPDEEIPMLWEDDFWKGFFSPEPDKIVNDSTSSRQAAIDQGVEPWAASQVAQRAPRRWKKAYDNGYIPDDAMVKIDDQGNHLRPDAAAAFFAMRRAARKQGITITLSGAASGYRSYQTQVDLKEQKGNLAATPGHSNHGWGMAIDVGPEARAWITAHGAKWGFHQLPTESWHFDYVAGAYKAPTTKPDRNKPQERSVTRPMKPKVEPDLITPADPLVTFPMALAGILNEKRYLTTTKEGARQDPKAPTDYGKRLAFVPSQYRGLFLEAAKKYHVNPVLLAIIGKHESGFDKNVTSSAGAQGIMQIMPLHGLKNPFNPRENIFAGARIFASYLNAMGGDIRKGLAAYNAGPGNWEVGLGYADAILQEWRDG